MMSEPSLQNDLERAQRLHSAGQWTDAEAAYRGILARDPVNGAAIHLLGLLMVQTGRQPEGVQLVQQSLQIAPHHAPFHFNYGNVLLAVDPAGAAAAYQRALELQPDFPDAMSNLAVALCKQNK